MINTSVKAKKINETMFEYFSEEYGLYQAAVATLSTAERKKSRKVSINNLIIPFHKK
jgi:ABC-type Zn uptake system ZnuABC Zn-binding protein ZnuA